MDECVMMMLCESTVLMKNEEEGGHGERGASCLPTLDRVK